VALDATFSKQEANDGRTASGSVALDATTSITEANDIVSSFAHPQDRIQSTSNGWAVGPVSTISTDGQLTLDHNLMVVSVRYEGSPTTLTISDTAGNTWTSLTQRSTSVNTLHLQMFYVKDIVGNSADIVTVNFGSPVNRASIMSTELSGLDLTLPFASENWGTAESATTASTDSLPILGTGIVVASFASLAAQTSYTGNSDYLVTLNDDPTGAQYHGQEFKVTTTAPYVEFPSETVGTASDLLIVDAYFFDVNKAVGAPIEPSDVLAAEASLPTSTDLSVIEGNDTLSAAGTAILIGAVILEANDTDVSAASLVVDAVATLIGPNDTVVSTTSWDGIHAAASPTEGPDTLSTTSHSPLDATLTKTDDGDTVGVLVSTLIDAAVSMTEASDTESSGSSASPSASLSVVEAPDTDTASGTITTNLTTSVQEASDFIGSATAHWSVHAIANLVGAPDTLSGGSSETLDGIATLTELGDFVGSRLDDGSIFVVSVTDTGDSSIVNGSVTVDAVSNNLLPDDTVASSGTTYIGISALLQVANDQIVAQAHSIVQAVLSATEGPDTLAVTDTTKISIVVQPIEGADTSVSSASWKGHANASIHGAADNVSAAGSVSLHAQGSPRERNDTTIFSAASEGNIVLSQAEGNDVPYSMSGSPKISGTALPTEGRDRATANASPKISGVAQPIEGRDTLASSASVSLHARTGPFIELNDTMGGGSGLTTYINLVATPTENNDVVTSGSVTLGLHSDTALTEGRDIVGSTVGVAHSVRGVCVRIDGSWRELSDAEFSSGLYPLVLDPSTLALWQRRGQTTVPGTAVVVDGDEVRVLQPGEFLINQNQHG
jgi:hypothetical protein